MIGVFLSSWREPLWKRWPFSSRISWDFLPFGRDRRFSIERFHTLLCWIWSVLLWAGSDRWSSIEPGFMPSKRGLIPPSWPKTYVFLPPASSSLPASASNPSSAAVLPLASNVYFRRSCRFPLRFPRYRPQFHSSHDISASRWGGSASTFRRGWGAELPEWRSTCTGLFLPPTAPASTYTAASIEGSTPAFVAAD